MTASAVAASGGPYTEYVHPTCSTRYVTDAYANPNYVMDASGFGNPANVQVNTPNGGSNQYWCTDRLADGYLAIFSYYPTNNKGANNFMCLNVNSYSSGAQVQAHQCNTQVAVSEQWQLVGQAHGWAIEPADNYYGANWCANSSGGIRLHAPVILYSCSGFPPNEQWDNVSF